MRNIVTAGVAAALALTATTTALANHKPGHPEKGEKAARAAKAKARATHATKVTICHRTMSATNPHRTIQVSRQAWEHGHSKHGDQMGACQGGAPRAAKELSATLTPVSGATGSGTFHADVRLLKNRALVCYTLTVTGVDATAAHIHTQAAQTIGGESYAAAGIVVPLKTPNSQGAARGCASVTRAVGEVLVAQPGAFYVNVHTAAFPAGQVRGALASG